MFQFICQNGLQQSGEDQRAIRSQAMRNFRRQQRLGHRKRKDSAASPSCQLLGLPKRVKRLLPAVSAEPPISCNGALRSYEDTSLDSSDDCQSSIGQELTRTSSVKTVKTLLSEDDDAQTLARADLDNTESSGTTGTSCLVDAYRQHIPSETSLQTIEYEDDCAHNIDHEHHYDANPSMEVIGSLFDAFSQYISEIATPQLQREQLHYAFVTSYYADPVISSNYLFINTYHSLAPQSLAIDASRDALSLIHLGTRFHDQALLHEGRKAHLKALHLIRTEIVKPQAITNDALLGACYTLAHCEIYRIISEQVRTSATLQSANTTSSP